jgi:hypothetical protein
MAANRVGKSEAGAFEVTCHLTGSIRLVDRETLPASGRSGGRAARTVRRRATLCRPSSSGRSMRRRGDDPGASHRRHDSAEAYQAPWKGRASSTSRAVKASSGLKSYEQGRQSFEGTAKHGIWDDEEPPDGCLHRAAAADDDDQGRSCWSRSRRCRACRKWSPGFSSRPTQRSTSSGLCRPAGKTCRTSTTRKSGDQGESTPLYQIQARMDGEPVPGGRRDLSDCRRGRVGADAADSRHVAAGLCDGRGLEQNRGGLGCGRSRHGRH